MAALVKDRGRQGRAAGVQVGDGGTPVPAPRLVRGGQGDALDLVAQTHTPAILVVIRIRLVAQRVGNGDRLPLRVVAQVRGLAQVVRHGQRQANLSPSPWTVPVTVLSRVSTTYEVQGRSALSRSRGARDIAGHIAC